MNAVHLSVWGINCLPGTTFKLTSNLKFSSRFLCFEPVIPFLDSHDCYYQDGIEWESLPLVPILRTSAANHLSLPVNYW